MLSPLPLRALTAIASTVSMSQINVVASNWNPISIA
jgi:hypothetical protein